MGQKMVITLGTDHGMQILGRDGNRELARAIISIKSEYGVQVIFEEWSCRLGQSLASTLTTENLEWENVGTSDEEC